MTIVGLNLSNFENMSLNLQKNRYAIVQIKFGYSCVAENFADNFPSTSNFNYFVFCPPSCFLKATAVLMYKQLPKPCGFENSRFRQLLVHQDRGGLKKMVRHHRQFRLR
jgi:hypothetical protein